VLELVIGCLALLELPVVGLVVLEELEDGFRILEEELGREVVTRLVVTLLGLRLDVTLLDREDVGVLVVNVLVELLRLELIEVLDRV
jgi:hypothetical protein